MSLGGNAVKIFTTRTVTAGITRPSDTTTYAVADAISAVTTNGHYTFSNVVEERAGMIVSATLHSSAAVSPNLDADLVLFRTDIATKADNLAWAPTDAEMLTSVGRIPFPSSGWTLGGANTSCYVTGLQLAFTDDGSSGALYGQLVARSAYVPTSAEVFTVDLVVSQD